MLSTCRSHQRARALAFVLVFALVIGLIALSTGTSGRAMRGNSDRHTLAPNDKAASEVPSQAQAAAAFGKVEMSFEPNHGQTDDQVKFLARGAGYTVFLTATEAVFVLAPQDGAQAKDGNAVPADSSSNAITTSTTPPTVLRMKLEGANPASEAVGLQKLEGIVNYFKGSDPAKWRTEIPTFARVRYSEIYSGIDLVYYGTQRQLEYDFVVSPGADYAHVSLAFEGADGMELDGASGDLMLKVGENTIRQHKPFVYQEIDGERREVESGYELRGEGRVGFAVGRFDAAKPLIIDPVLAYSTFLGGGSFDAGRGIAVDAAGNAYVIGSTTSVNFPSQNPLQSNSGGSQDAFVSKLNATGSALIYSTYLGGDQTEIGNGLAVDSAGSAYLIGNTTSTNFPIVGAIDETRGGSQDAFVSKLNATGSALIYSTYLGGGSIEEGHGIAVDAAGNAYVTGQTSSSDFPTTNAFDSFLGGSQDAFFARLNAAGSALVRSTYLGGGGVDTGNGIAIDSTGNAYLIGQTDSINFPTTNGFDSSLNGGRDAFVTKFIAVQSTPAYSTYLGGDGDDFGSGIAADTAGNAYVIGDTLSTDFPTQNPFQSDQPSLDAFVTKLNAAGSALVYSTYLGGNQFDFGRGIAVDAAGDAYVVGRTASTDFPTANTPYQSDQPGPDVFVSHLNAAGSALVYSTYLGGDSTDDAGGVAVDAAGNTYITGNTLSTNFPVTSGAFQAGKSGSDDAFISKIGDYLISGRVIDSGGNGIAGVNITLSGASSDIHQTDASGSFLFLDTTSGGNYVVTPTSAGLTFAPPSQQIGSLNNNQDLLFTGTPPPPPSPSPTPTPTLVQFSESVYSVREGEGSIEIIVTRTGDLSRITRVNYATTDGTASDRSDYTTAVGRLVFLTGESAMSFRVFITDDAFAEGNESINLTLSDPGSGALGSPSTARITIRNDASNSPANPIDESVFFVRQHYHDFLNREPDPAGLAFWVNNIESCGANQACRETKRIDTSASFFLSIEFQETGFLALRTYRAAFSRFPVYREFIGDARLLVGDGLIVGQDNWQEILRVNKLGFALAFVQRPDFTSIYSGMTNAQYVDALNANTGGSLSQAERDTLVAGLDSMTETRHTVLQKVAEDPDFAAREINPAFVLLQYFGYLRRNPNDPPDADFSGYDFWLAKLNQFGGDFRRAEMVRAFITSFEYRQRFGP